jgi:hypothetical protein
MENKFLEAMKQLVTYGNREFLRSFKLKTEIIHEGSSSNNNNNKEIPAIDTTITSLVPPFQTMGFLESKWLEMIKELVEYGNKNILRNFKLYLTVEEKREGEESKEISNCILDIKREEGAEVHNHINNNNHNHNKNQSWSRPRDKFGRFIPTSTYTSQL